MDFIANLIAPNHKSNSSAQSKSTKPFSSTSERMEQVHVFKEGEIIGDFTVKKRLGEGGCGVVYKVLDKQNQPYAMKVEPSTRKKTDQLLPLEAQILKRLQFSPYASEFVLYAKTPDFRVLVMGLLGPSLTQLQDEQTGYKFSIGTVLRIGLQSLRAIAFLHSIWFVHRDIKPSNFAIDLKNCRRIYLIDYGLSRSLKKRGTQKLRKPRDDVPFRGTPGYCSLNAHMRKEHGRHDDLWSMIYMLVDMVSGTLPWFKHSRASTALLKQSLMDFEYMFDCPVAFSTILNYLRALNYYQRPDYVGMEEAFIQMMRLRDVNESQPMDWEINSLKKDQQGKSIRPYTKALLEPPADQAEGSGSGSGASGTLKYTYSNKSDSS